MTIKIIFFVWIALVDTNGFQVTSEVESFYDARCKEFGGSLTTWRSNLRRYRFTHSGLVKERHYSGYDLICFKVVSK